MRECNSFVYVAGKEFLCMTQFPEEYDVPSLASLDSPPTPRRGGSISIPKIAFSSIFSETGEFLLTYQKCYLGGRISWLRSTWIYSFCVLYLPMFKHPPIPQWKEMLLICQAPKSSMICFVTSWTRTSVLQILFYLDFSLPDRNFGNPLRPRTWKN